MVSVLWRTDNCSLRISRPPSESMSSIILISIHLSSEGEIDTSIPRRRDRYIFFSEGGILVPKDPESPGGTESTKTEEPNCMWDPDHGRSDRDKVFKQSLSTRVPPTTIPFASPSTFRFHPLFLPNFFREAQNCLLWRDKSRVTEKTYIWVTVGVMKVLREYMMDTQHILSLWENMYWYTSHTHFTSMMTPGTHTHIHRRTHYHQDVPLGRKWGKRTREVAKSK